MSSVVDRNRWYSTYEQMQRGLERKRRRHTAFYGEKSFGFSFSFTLGLGSSAERVMLTVSAVTCPWRTIRPSTLILSPGFALAKLALVKLTSVDSGKGAETCLPPCTATVK